MKTKSLLFCFVFAVYTNIHTANAQVNGQDSLALVDLYNSTNGPNWFNHTNWLTKAPVSTWYRIRVTGARVTAITLYENNLSGSIPSSIGNLTNLQNLDLSYGYIASSIPSSIGNLINLQSLYLYNNQLSGSIPSSIGNLINLQSLALTGNQLSGPIPSSIGNLIKLSGDLELEYNQLSGPIPSSIGNLINLTSLELENNRLSGPISSSIGNLINLQYGLILSNNQLSDSIPSSIGNLVKLNLLELDNNRLSGSIPSSIGNLVKLYYLNFSHNYFTFKGMELIAQKFPFAIYDHQKNIPIHQTGNTLSVSAGGTLSNNTYKLLKWERTTPVLVATSHGDSVFHPAVRGIYQVKILNSVATGLVLYSKVIDYTAPNNTLVASAKNELQQSGKANMFRIYPNPARDVLHVETNSSATFSLIDQSGKILLTTNITGKGSINISGITPGLYYLKNNSTGNVQKVVIAR